VCNNTFEAIDALTYTDEDGEVIQIGVGIMSPFRFPLRVFKRYHLFRIDQGDLIGDDWTGITAQDCDDFRVSHKVDQSGTSVMQRTRRLHIFEISLLTSRKGSKEMILMRNRFMHLSRSSIIQSSRPKRLATPPTGDAIKKTIFDFL
jgi:hypothetical protein